MAPPPAPARSRPPRLLAALATVVLASACGSPAPRPLPESAAATGAAPVAAGTTAGTTTGTTTASTATGRTAADTSAGGVWSAAPPMRHARAAHAVVSTGTALYALAGTGSGAAPVLAVEKFDGEAWTEETTLPGDGLNAPAAAVLGGKIYLVGGFSTVTNVPTSGVHVYDVARRTWSEAAPLPAPRGGHAAVVLDGRIHVLGGGNSRSTIADHTVYDPAANAWTERAPLPRAKGSPAVVAHGGRLYAIGGRSGPGDFGEVDVYDAAADRWTPGPAIPPRGTHGAAVYRGAVHLFGGESQARQATLASVLRLDPAAGAWREAPPMPTARSFARAVPLGGAVYVVGGSPTYGSSHSSTGGAVVERYEARCVR